MKTRLNRMAGLAVAALLASAGAAGAQSMAPLAPTVVAGDTFPLTITGLPTNTNGPASTVYIESEDPTRVIPLAASWTQTIDPATGLWYAGVSIRVAAFKREDGLFSPIPVYVVVERGGGVIWSGVCDVTVADPTLSFNPSAPVLSAGDTIPLTLRRTVQASGALGVTLTMDSPGVALFTYAGASGLVSSASVVMDPFRLSQPLYVTGLQDGVARLTARVGSYSTNVDIVVTAAVQSNDPDGDGLSNEWEALLGGDPNNPNTFSPSQNDGEYDSDGDGLTNLEEIETYGTDPRYSDTDDDGVGDMVEVSTDVTHPAQPMSRKDFQPRSLNMGAVAAGGVNLPDDARFGVGTGGWTAEAWIWPDADGDGTIFLASNTVSRTGYWFGLEGYRPTVRLFANNSELVSAGGAAIQALPTNRWSHLACVWSPERNSLEIFIDGVLLVARETLSAPDFSGFNMSFLARGFTSGWLDEFRFWATDRTWEQIDTWRNRLAAAPAGYVLEPDYGQPLKACYRFDDAGTHVEDFAFLNDRTRSLVNLAVHTTTDRAAVLLGSDDEDGDQLPEWWVGLHNLEQYSRLDFGPAWNGEYFDDRHPKAAKAAQISFFKSFTAYGSIGSDVGYVQPEAESIFYFPVDGSLEDDGRYSEFLKYVYLPEAPRSARLEVFTPGMTSTVVYVNGERVTPAGQQGDSLQSFEVAGRLRAGRNQVYVECESIVVHYRDFDRAVPGEMQDGKYFEKAVGKFDARLTCDGNQVIVRGDQTRADPRAVWHGHAWSQLWQDQRPFSGRPDLSDRYAPGNPDYGLPFDADTDSMNALYEYYSGTNPRDDDSNNNGVPDGQEDFDGDGLVNRDEQSRGSDPLLADSDDDGTIDGLDPNPASALTPSVSRALDFSGGHVAFPLERRFAMSDWTLEAWVNRSPLDLDGGVIVQRLTGPGAINYELGLGDGAIAPANALYVRFSSPAGATVSTAASFALGAGWVHVAATYDSTRRELLLYTNGVLVATAAQAMASPAIYAGGPVIQRIGAGFTGQIDDVRLWKSARSAEQIADNHETALSGTETDLVAYYRADDGTIYAAGSPTVGTSANNGTNGLSGALAWTHGQVQDFASSYLYDWWNKWTRSASFEGAAGFTAAGGGALDVPPSLRVNITPSAAVLAGAQWALQGIGTWRDSGTTVYEGLDAGSYTIIYKATDGWSAPSNRVVSLTNGVMTTVYDAYVQNGSLNVEFLFVNELLYGAQWPVADARWRIIGGMWMTDGATLDNLAPGFYTVEFQAPPGWAPPASAVVEVRPGDTTLYIGQFAPAKGGVRVFIEPQPLPAAQWSLDGGTPLDSGLTLTNLSLGSHTVTFSDVVPWQTPEPIAVNLTNSVVVTVTGRYSQVTGLQVFLQPAAAVSGGAAWAAGGSWLASGSLLEGSAGEFNVTFKPVAGWTEPSSIPVSVSNDVTTLLTGRYFKVEAYGPTNSWAVVPFNAPRGLALDAMRRLYIADSGNHRIVVLDTRDLGVQSIGAAGAAAGQFNQPFGVGVGPDGSVYVADTHNHRVQRLDPTWTSWVVFGGPTQGTGLGQFTSPYDVLIDSAGQLFVSERDSHRVQRRLATPWGVTSSVWSVIVSNAVVDGGVRYPIGLATDGAGALYVSDYPNNQGRIQTFTTNGQFTAKIGGFSDEMGGLVKPHRMARTPDGRLYVADPGSNRVLWRDGSGQWTVLLDTNHVKAAEGLAWDPRGYLYVADTGNNRILRVELDATSTAIPPTFNASLPGPGGVTISWQGAVGWFYRVEYTDNLVTPSWAVVPGCVDVPGVDGPMNCQDTTNTSSPTRMYRVVAY